MQTTNYCKHELIKEVNELIQRWSDERPQVRTLAHLGREAGVSDSALRRLKNQKAKIADDMLFKIVSVIFESSQFKDLKAKSNGLPNTSQWLLRHYSFLETNSAMKDFRFTEVSNDIVVNPIGFSIFGLVSSIRNVTKDYIRDQFGIRGLIEADTLVENGVLEFSNERYSLGARHNKVKITKKAVITLMPEITRLYLKEDTDISAELFEIDGVTREGYICLTKAFNEFIKISADIISQHQGDIPVVLSGFVNTMTTQPLKLEHNSENAN